MGNPGNGEMPRPGPLPDHGCGGLEEIDPEWARYVACLDREAEPWDPEPWDAEQDDLDPGGPVSGAPIPGSVIPGAPVPGVRVPSGQPVPLFAEGGVADVMPPGPLLAALTEQAVGDVMSLSDGELVGMLQATQRQMAREQYKQALAAAEFGRRRRAAFQAALARGVPAGCAPGGFPGEELAIELTVSRAEAGHLIDDAIDLTTRLPKTLAGMAAGLIDAEKAGWIAFYTRSLSPADAARADEVLAGDAPELRVEQLARRADALEKKLNPEGAKARRERARRDGQRVEARREASGNASLAGRELEVADVLASKAYLDSVAARLHACGIAGSLDRLRALALTDLTQGRDPLDRINPAPVSGQPDRGQSDRDQSAGPPPVPPEDAEAPGEDGGSRGPARPSGLAPVPALINLLLPAETLLGLSATPAQAGGWGLLDADDARTMAAAAAAHPATRWCLTLTGPDGTALAHGCARGSRPRLLDGLQPQPPPTQPSPAQSPPASLAELLRRLNITLTPVTRGTCDHAHAEDGYVPSRTLRHLVRARTATCDAPGCHNAAASTDLDHTVPWPAGPTDQCNLAPRCRTHHRAKQAPDWTVEQTAPGVTRWTLPSGRTHLTAPTKYDT